MQEEEIKEFLLRAKKATYAGNGPEMPSSRPNSKDLEYIEGSLRYIDTYLGAEKFAGEEALWLDNKPFWSMNYVGRVTGTGFDGDFLKEALSYVPLDIPYRGPKEFRKGSLTYSCTVEGDFEWFIGHEEIYFKNVKVYECMFHGGSVK